MLGLIGRKVGMTQVFDEKGKLTPVTVIKFDENVVVSERTEEKEGYTACVLASVDKKASRVTKPVAGQFPEGVNPKRYIREFRDFEGEYTVGQKMGVEIFEDMDLVDVIGTTKGKGYQGVMKRHGFGGGRKTNGMDSRVAALLTVPSSTGKMVPPVWPPGLQKLSRVRRWLDAWASIRRLSRILRWFV